MPLRDRRGLSWLNASTWSERPKPFWGSFQPAGTLEWWFLLLPAPLLPPCHHLLLAWRRRRASPWLLKPSCTWIVGSYPWNPSFPFGYYIWIDGHFRPDPHPQPEPWTQLDAELRGRTSFLDPRIFLLPFPIPDLRPLRPGLHLRLLHGLWSLRPQRCLDSPTFSIAPWFQIVVRWSHPDLRRTKEMKKKRKTFDPFPVSDYIQARKMIYRYTDWCSLLLHQFVSLLVLRLNGLSFHCLDCFQYPALAILVLYHVPSCPTARTCFHA